MAQTGYTPIQLYYSTTASTAPTAGNLANGELAINITDGKLFYKDNSAVVQVIGWKTVPTTAGGTGLTSYTAGDLLYYASGTTLSKLGIGATNTVLTSSGTAPQWSTGLTLSSASVIEVTDNTNAALRITQLGTGNALLVEDSTNPDATPFVIDSAGAVLSGYTSQIDTYRLQISTSNGVNQSNYRFSADTGGPIIRLAKSRSATIGTNSLVSSGDSLGSIRGFGADGTNYIESARIEFLVDNTSGTNDMPGRITFSTTADGASSVTERLRVDSAGNTYIETGALWQYSPAPTSKSGAATLTAAELLTGILNTTGTTYTITLPTGTAIDTGWPSAPTTDIGFNWNVINTAVGIITIAVGASGMTSLGTLTIATGVSAQFRLRRTAANTYVLYRLS